MCNPAQAEVLRNAVGMILGAMAVKANRNLPEGELVLVVGSKPMSLGSDPVAEHGRREGRVTEGPPRGSRARPRLWLRRLLVLPTAPPTPLRPQKTPTHPSRLPHPTLDTRTGVK